MITLETYQQRICALIEEYKDLNPEKLHEHVVQRYTLEVLVKLNQLFSNALEQRNNHETLLSELQGVLNMNWQQIKNNLLCYTALPHNPITELLCDIAEDIAAERNAKIVDPEQHIAPISLLMPGIVTETISDDYPNLTAPSTEEYNNSLRRIVSTHIISSDGNYLWPTTLLATATSQVELAKLPCPYFDFISQPLSATIPTLAKDEQRRLSEHSPASRAYHDALVQLDTLRTQENHLLGQLHLLLRYLTFSSVAGVGREEYADESAYAAVARFHNFYMQLDAAAKQQIPPTLIQEINTLLGLDEERLLLSKLLRYQSLDAAEKNERYTETEQRQLDDELNRNRHRLANFNPEAAPINSCLNTRRATLETAMEGHENLLATIGLAETQIVAQLDRAKANLAAAKVDLTRQSANATGATNARDSLGIKPVLLERLNITFSVRSYIELVDLVRNLTGDELAALLESSNNASMIVQAIGTFENLILLNTEMSNAILTVFYRELGKALAEQYLNDAEDFGALLSALTPEQIRFVLTGLQQHVKFLQAETKDMFKIGVTLSRLDANQIRTFFQVLNNLYGCIEGTGSTNAISNLSTLFNGLSEEQCSVILDIFKNKYLSWVGSAEDFSCLLCYLSQEQRTNIYEDLKTNIPNWTWTPESLRNLLNNLSPAQCTETCAAIQTSNPSPIASLQAFIAVLSGLNSEQRGAVNSAFKAQFPSWVTTPELFNALLRQLSPAQCIETCASIQENKPGLVASAEAFKALLSGVNSEQSNAVYAAFKAQFPSWVTSPELLNALLLQLSPAQCVETCASIQENKPGLVASAEAFKALLSGLNSEQSNAVYAAFKDQFPSWVTSADSYRAISSVSQREEKRALYRAFKAQFAVWATSPESLSTILRELSFDDFTEECTAIRNNNPGLVSSLEAYMSLLSGLIGYQQHEAYDIFKTQFPTWVTTPESFNALLRKLYPPRSTEVCVMLKDKLNAQIRSPQDFKTLVSGLERANFDAVYQAVKAHNPDVFGNIQKWAVTKDGYLSLCRYADLNDIAQTLKSLDYHALSSSINSIDDLTEIFKIAHPKALVYLLIALKEKVSELVKSQSSFNTLLQLFLTLPRGPNDYSEDDIHKDSLTRTAFCLLTHELLLNLNPTTNHNSTFNSSSSSSDALGDVESSLVKPLNRLRAYQRYKTNFSATPRIDSSNWQIELDTLLSSAARRSEQASSSAIETIITSLTRYLNVTSGPTPEECILKVAKLLNEIDYTSQTSFSKFYSSSPSSTGEAAMLLMQAADICETAIMSSMHPGISASPSAPESLTEGKIPPESQLTAHSGKKKK